MLEAIAPVAKAAAVQEPFSPALAATIRTAKVMGRAELEHVFATELAEIDPAVRDRAVDACDALTGADGWDFLRVHRGLEPHEATETLAFSLRQLLGPQATTASHRHARRWRARPSAKPADPGGEERR